MAGNAAGALAQWIGTGEGAGIDDWLNKDVGKVVENSIDDVGEFPGKSYSGTRNPDVDFTNNRRNSTFRSHFNDHAGDFGYNNEEEYLTGSRDFLEKPPTLTTLSFVTKDGTYFRYDTATNEFGILSKYGGVSTYFKPDRGMNYWLEQLELYAPKN